MSAQIRANQATQAQGMFGMNTVGASNFANTAAGGANKQGELDAGDRNAQRQLVGNSANAAGSMMAMSDEREKKNVSKVSDPQMDAFVKHLSSFSFDYKDPDRDGEGPRMGVMAGDVQKGGPIGKDVVVDGKRLKLDVGNGIGAALGAIGYLAKRVKELEGRRA